MALGEWAAVSEQGSSWSGPACRVACMHWKHGRHPLTRACRHTTTPRAAWRMDARLPWRVASAPAGGTPATGKHCSHLCKALNSTMRARILAGGEGPRSWEELVHDDMVPAGPCAYNVVRHEPESVTALPPCYVRCGVVVDSAARGTAGQRESQNLSIFSIVRLP